MGGYYYSPRSVFLGDPRKAPAASTGLAGVGGGALGTQGTQLANLMHWEWINSPLGQGFGAALSKSFPSAFANASDCCLKAAQERDKFGA